MVYLTRVSYFNAAHKLQHPDWTLEKNKEHFGKCANENWHGHNYELHVTIKGLPAPDSGFVFDAKRLGDLMEEHAVEKLDHKNLNLDVDFMQGKFTSVENVAIAVWEQLEAPIKAIGVELYRVKLFETMRIYAEYYGPAGRR